MKFLNNQPPMYDLTYSDVFLVPSKSNLESRFAVDTTPIDGTGATIPIVVSNMTAVAGKRMAETIARRGGLVVLPQDMPYTELESTLKYIKSRHLVYETPLLLEPRNTIAEALSIIHKRSHGAIIVTDSRLCPVGIFKEVDAEGHDLFTPLEQVMRTDLVTVPDGLPAAKIYELLHRKRVTVAPVIKQQRVIGLATQKGALRSTIYTPAIDKHNHLATAVAVGINGNVADKVKKVLSIGAD